jgi:tetratricopeptide (TPR) repeat protein
MVVAVRTLGFLALCVCSSVVSAQAGSAATAAASSQPAPAVNDEVARGLFQAGKAAYESGNYPDAIGFFEQAYARSQRPQLLFNIGQVADRLRQDDKALASFRAYVQQVPDAPNRVEVESRIAALERAAAEREASAATPPPSAAPTPAQTAAQASGTGARDDAALAQSDAATTTGATSATPVTKKWWFWTSVGAVVVGGTAVALALALGGGSTGQQAAYQGSAGSLKGP